MIPHWIQKTLWCHDGERDLFSKSEHCTLKNEELINLIFKSISDVSFALNNASLIISDLHCTSKATPVLSNRMQFYLTSFEINKSYKLTQDSFCRSVRFKVFSRLLITNQDLRRYAIGIAEGNSSWLIHFVIKEHLKKCVLANCNFAGPPVVSTKNRVMIFKH